MKGFVAFVLDGNLKIVEAERGCEPWVLGLGVLHELRLRGHLLEQSVRELEMLPPDYEISVSDRRALDVVANLAGQNPASLVHATLAAQVAMDAWHVPSSGSTVNYGYVVDLDLRRLEAYRGEQTVPHRLGRFLDRQQVHRGSIPPRLVADWAIPDAALGLEATGNEDPLPSDNEFLTKIAEGVSLIGSSR